MPSAVVVGAGFAGLAAADALAHSGWDVTVLEARDRVGGRVHSRRLANGAVVELGAEFVLPGHDVLRRTVGRLDLALYEKGTLYGRREPRGGEPVSAQELAAAVARLPAAGGEGTLLDALDRLALAPAVREAIVARIEVSTGHPAADQAASVLAEGAAGFGDFASHGVGGGNQELAHALAGRLGARVRVGAPVERVGWSARGGVRAAGPAGELAADACVVAVPASVVDRISFEPPLPDWKRDALAAVRYAHAAKLFVPLAGPAPPSATLSVPGRFWVYTQRAPGGESLAAAVAFAGTAAAIERVGGAEAWLAAVRELRPDLPIAADAEPLLSTWHDDPWVRGAYSARSLASPLRDDELAAPVGPLAFAGEHTAGAWHGLMEGALRSGARAAADLREALAPRERAS